MKHIKLFEEFANESIIEASKPTDDLLNQFEDWIEDGNAVKMKDGWATQDAQYRNRLKTKDDLLKYFIKEFK